MKIYYLLYIQSSSGHFFMKLHKLYFVSEFAFVSGFQAVNEYIAIKYHVSSMSIINFYLAINSKNLRICLDITKTFF